MPVQQIELEEVTMVEASDDALEAGAGGQLYSIQCVSAHCS
jgi:hypothetical protein